MIKVPETEKLTEFDLENFTRPLVEKYIDKRGYLYILYDSKFPEFIKVGRTSNCKTRLIGYNSDKPFPTAKMLYISKLFENANEMERRILAFMYDCTSPTTLSREWFMIEHKKQLIEIIEKAEKDNI
jgi:hypothetical protein